MRIRRNQYEDKASENARRNLTDNIETKIETVMIGSIASFENNFGHLWGIGLDESELTENQRKLRQQWERTRCDILNKGNSQKRKIGAEIQRYNVRYMGYSYEFRERS